MMGKMMIVSIALFDYIEFCSDGDYGDGGNDDDNEN
jgi:hypothetical protein